MKPETITENASKLIRDNDVITRGIEGLYKNFNFSPYIPYAQDDLYLISDIF